MMLRNSNAALQLRRALSSGPTSSAPVDGNGGDDSGGKKDDKKDKDGAGDAAESEAETETVSKEITLPTTGLYVCFFLTH